MNTRRGYGLVELMVALAIGAIVVAAALAAWLRARALGDTLEAGARLQDTAQYALSVLASDLRMAGYFGLTRRSVTADPTLAFPARCGGTPWLTAIDPPVAGVDDGYLAVANCAASGGGARPGTDVLLLRRASAVRMAPQRDTFAAVDHDRVLVVTGHDSGRIFVPSQTGNRLPSGYATADVAGQSPQADTRALLVHAYYVSRDSTGARGWPALRRKVLVAGPDVSDEEVIAGVEDLQLRFGYDDDGDGDVDRYTGPTAPPAGSTPVAVQLCLCVVAERRDASTGDQQVPACGTRPAWTATDRHPRLVVSRTVALRNTGP
jgi:type IV pilus assembly protein PilW